MRSASDPNRGDPILISAITADPRRPLSALVNSFSTSYANSGLSSNNPDFEILATYPGGQAALGYLRHGAGDLAWLTDFNTFDNSRFGDLDNQVLWTNLFGAAPAPGAFALFGLAVLGARRRRPSVLSPPATRRRRR